MDQQLTNSTQLYNIQLATLLLNHTLDVNLMFRLV